MPSTVATSCLHCNEPFLALRKEVNRGYAKFCSKECFAAYRLAQQRPRREPNLSCAFCGIDFFRVPSKIKNATHGIHFCSRECKDQAQRVGGISAIQPSHYGNGSSIYRDIAFRNSGALVCTLCGYSKIPEVLEVHHIDEDRKNADKDNLSIVCPTCHQEIHYRNKSGRYKGNPKQ